MQPLIKRDFQINYFCSSIQLTLISKSTKYLSLNCFRLSHHCEREKERERAVVVREEGWWSSKKRTTIISFCVSLISFLFAFPLIICCLHNPDCLRPRVRIYIWWYKYIGLWAHLDLHFIPYIQTLTHTRSVDDDVECWIEITTMKSYNSIKNEKWVMCKMKKLRLWEPYCFHYWSLDNDCALSRFIFILALDLWIQLSVLVQYFFYFFFHRHPDVCYSILILLVACQLAISSRSWDYFECVKICFFFHYEEREKKKSFTLLLLTSSHSFVFFVRRANENFSPRL